MSAATPKADRERGAVLVEAAFVLPILFFLLLGFLELSLVIAGNSAGRARHAMVSGSGSCNTRTLT